MAPGPNVPQIQQLAAALGFPSTPLIYSSLRDLGRYDQMIGGHTYEIDLTQGLLIDQTAGTTTQLSGFDQRLRGAVRSAAIFVSDADTEIILGSNTMFNDHQLYHEFNDLSVLSITIIPPVNKIPNLIDLNFLLSNAPIIENIYKRDLQKGLHTKKFITGQTTTNSFADILRIHMGAYSQLNVAIAEVGGVNSVDWQVLVSNDDINYYVLTGVTFNTINASGYALFQTTQEWHFYRIQVKSHTSGSPGSINMQASPIN